MTNISIEYEPLYVNSEDTLNLIDTLGELLEPLTERRDHDAADLYDLTRRSQMVYSILRSAREKASAVYEAVSHAEPPAPMVNAV